MAVVVVFGGGISGGCGGWGGVVAVEVGADGNTCECFGLLVGRGKAFSVAKIVQYRYPASYLPKK